MPLEFERDNHRIGSDRIQRRQEFQRRISRSPPQSDRKRLQQVASPSFELGCHLNSKGTIIESAQTGSKDARNSSVESRGLPHNPIGKGSSRSRALASNSDAT